MNGNASALRSGKGHHDENFPVASFLIHPRHRAPILAFYRFARTADDVADHPSASAEEKLSLLDGMQESLLGTSTVSPESALLKQVLAEYGLSPQHALDLLIAFRRDVTKLRYANWHELLDYCRYSAMPVGRFVLDVHGEDRAAWPCSDALCSALQIINHLQDCGKDYRALDRVYLPLDMLAECGTKVEALSATHASPQLLQAVARLAARNDVLLREAAPFASMICDFRLGLEVSIIQRFAESLNCLLLNKDPLSERVHHRKTEMFGLGLGAAAHFLLSPRKRTPIHPALER